MKRMRLPLILLIAVLIPALAMAQEKLTYEEYQAQLEQAQLREQQAQVQIDQLTSELQEMQSEMDSLDLEIGTVWQSIYSMMDIETNKLRQFADELDAIDSDLQSYETLSPEQVYQKRQDLEGLQVRLNKVTENKAAVLSRYKDVINDLEVRLEDIEVRVPTPRGTYYTVVRGDHLWGIAAKPKIYGNGMKWMRIYSVNHDQIRDPDLIFPKQVFAIPMDIQSGQYLVQPGQNLSSIAESLFDDPFKWRTIYEANRGIINDPTMIYPEMILTVPGR